MNKSIMLKDAISEFKKSEMESGDYLNLFMVVTQCTRQGSGLFWSDVESIIKETEENEFELTYPTYESYMKRVDFYLENQVGLGHDHCVDYTWMSAYEDQIPPNESVDEFLFEYMDG